MRLRGTVVISQNPVISEIVPACTGGTETEVAGKRIHTFTSGGTLKVNFPVSVEYLVVGGGGGGGGTAGDSGPGGGGGAGGVLTGTTILSEGNKAIVVGAGGPAITDGDDSTFNGLTAVGGGHGAEEDLNAGDGGSGGGGGYTVAGLGGTGTAGQGNNGGTSHGKTSPYECGGGGGAGAVGGNWAANQSGAGGNGVASSISGASVTYGGGGGGGSTQAGAARGLGGTGGGGAGAATYNVVGTAGTPNTGGGGGGSHRNAGGAGGSGIVIVSYTIADASLTRERFSRTLTPGQYEGLRMGKRALGKYHRCTFRMHGDRYDLQEMFTNGLMREVRVYGPDGRPHWGGFIYEMKFNLGWIEATVSMTEVYNKVWLRYRITGASTTTRSTPQSDTVSQGKYGVKEYVITAGELQTSVVADQVAAQYLELFRLPKVTPKIFFDKPLLQRPYIEITAFGWKDTLNFMVFNNTGSASQQSSPAEIADIVTASGQFIAGTHLDGNATQVSKISDLDRRAGDFIDDITRLGDPDNNRWVNGVDIERNLIFKQAEPPE